MATNFYTRSADGRFQITLETDRLEHYVFMQEAARICVDAKPADFKPVVHGRWEQYPSVLGYLRCSVCHDAYIDEEWQRDGKWCYCPNCGARMDGGESNAVD